MENEKTIEALMGLPVVGQQVEQIGGRWYAKGLGLNPEAVVEYKGWSDSRYHVGFSVGRDSRCETIYVSRTRGNDGRVAYGRTIGIERSAHFKMLGRLPAST